MPTDPPPAPLVVEATPPPPAAPDDGLARGQNPVAGRTLAVTAVVATVGVVVALIGLGLLLRPLRSPTQDCGTAISYLLEGRVDILVDPADPPRGVTAAEARANNAKTCQARAGDRAKPAGALVVGGTGLAGAAAAVDGSVRFLRRRRR